MSLQFAKTKLKNAKAFDLKRLVVLMQTSRRFFKRPKYNLNIIRIKDF